MQTGSLEVGKLADFVVLEENLFEVDVEAISETRALATYFAGRQVYPAKAIAGSVKHE